MPPSSEMQACRRIQTTVAHQAMRWWSRRSLAIMSRKVCLNWARKRIVRSAFDGPGNRDSNPLPH